MIANITLTTKEKFLLEDQKTNEEQCIQKYSNYTNLASDDQLKAVFRSNGKKEEEHLQTINQLLSGSVPSMNNQPSGGQQQSQQQQQPAQPQEQPKPQSDSIQQQGNSTNFKASDKDLCTDALMTEKYVSGAYNTAIFEFRDAQVRDVLNHIQKEEQKHGEAIYMYMESKGMYSPK